ncbi:unnamed protein product [Peniophora sp. CBMAI 1063]|nr:unnamed protein product [Peniophora sp. CBMAI 1063]
MWLAISSQQQLPPLLEKLASVASRFRTLEVRVNCASLRDATRVTNFLRVLRQDPLPSLDTVSLELRPPSVWVLPDDLSALAARNNEPPCKAPALRLLRMRHTFVPFLAPNLHYLDIRDCASFTIHDLFLVLRNVPELRYLRWQRRNAPNTWDLPILAEDIEQPPKPVTLPHLDSIHLPHLRSFDVTDGPSQLSLFAQTISSPPVRWTRQRPPNPPTINFAPIQTITRDVVEDIARASAHFISRLVPVSASGSVALTIPSSTYRVYHLLLSEGWDPASRKLHSVPCTIFGLGCYIDRAWASPLAALVKGVVAPFASDIRSLYVTGDILYDPMERDYPLEHTQCTLSESFSTLLNISELYLASEATGLLEVLRRPASSSGGTGVIFPLLDTIILDHTDRHCEWPRGTSQTENVGVLYSRAPPYKHLAGVWWDAFCAMLADRVALGHKLRRLILRGRTCHVRRDEGERAYLEPLWQLQELSEWVDEVVDERDACGMKDGRDNPY